MTGLPRPVILIGGQWPKGPTGRIKPEATCAVHTLVNDNTSSGRAARKTDQVAKRLFWIRILSYNMRVDNNTFAPWLEFQYLDWQKRQGGRRSAKEFAAYLGFENATVNQWLNGHRRPTPEHVFILAQRLGLEVYDALGLLRPDELLFRIQADWHLFTESERDKIAALLEGARRRRERESKARPVRSSE